MVDSELQKPRMIQPTWAKESRPLEVYTKPEIQEFIWFLVEPLFSGRIFSSGGAGKFEGTIPKPGYGREDSSIHPNYCNIESFAEQRKIEPGRSSWIFDHLKSRLKCEKSRDFVLAKMYYFR